MPLFRVPVFLLSYTCPFSVHTHTIKNVHFCLLSPCPYIYARCSADVDNKQVRLRAFARVFFACAQVDLGASGPSIDSATGEEVTDLPCVMGLINRLHALLAKMERFEVRVCCFRMFQLVSGAHQLDVPSLFHCGARLEK